MPNEGKALAPRDRTITGMPRHRLFVRALCRATTRATGNMPAMEIAVTGVTLAEAFLAASLADLEAFKQNY